MTARVSTSCKGDKAAWTTSRATIPTTNSAPARQARRTANARQAGTFLQLVPERMFYDVLLRHRPSSWLDGRFSIALTGLTVIEIIAVVSTQRQSLGGADALPLPLDTGPL